MSRFVLVSFCNIPTITTSPLLCLQLSEEMNGFISSAPVVLGYPDCIFTATGLARTGGKIFVLFASREGSFHVAVLRENDLLPLYYQELPDVKDGHTMLAVDNYLYVVSTGTDEVVCYEIKEKSLENPKVIWRASNTKTDTHHINSIVKKDDELFVSAFGPKKGVLWSTASNGYIHNITRDIRLHDGIYHPHTLSVRNGEFYYCESHEGTFRSVEKILFKLNGYARGVEWLSDQLVCVATSIGRKVSKSTGLFSNPADQGQAAGQCMLTVNNIYSKEAERQLDLSWFGPEVYDVILLSGQYDLLEFARRAHLTERNALDKESKIVVSLSGQLKEQKQAVQNLSGQLKEQKRTVQNLSGRLKEKKRTGRNLSRRLENISRRLENISRRLENISRRLETREAELAKIHESKIWRLAAFLRRLRGIK